MTSTSTLRGASSCAPRRSSLAVGRRRRRALRAQPRRARHGGGPDRAATTRRSSACSSTAATTRRTWCCAPTRPRAPSTRGCAQPGPTRSRCCAPGTPVEHRRDPGLAGAPRRRAADRAASSPSRPRTTPHLRAASEHGRGARACSRAGRLAVLANVGPLVRAAHHAPTTRRTRSRGRRRSARTTTSSRPGRRSARKASRSAGAAASATWSRAATATPSSPASRSRATRCSGRPDDVPVPGRQQRRDRIGGIRHAVRLGRRRRRRCARSSRARQPAPVRAANTRRSSTARSRRRRRSRPPFDALDRSPAPTAATYDSPSTGSNAINGLAQQMQIGGAHDRRAQRARRQAADLLRLRWAASTPTTARTRSQADLLARLSHAHRRTSTACSRTSAASTCATTSRSSPRRDFGRTFTSNGDGTDHGWGAHHFVIGGAVKGGDIYGRFPQLGSVNSNMRLGRTTPTCRSTVGRHRSARRSATGSASATANLLTRVPEPERTSRATSVPEAGLIADRASGQRTAVERRRGSGARRGTGSPRRGAAVVIAVAGRPGRRSVRATRSTR